LRAGLVQLTLGMFVAQFQKVESVLVLHRQLGLIANFVRESLLKIGLIEQGFLVSLVLDLMKQYILCPAKFPGHTKVELTIKIVLAFFHDDHVF